MICIFRRISTGLVLFGPLLLMVFINDVPSAGVTIVHLFADDGRVLVNDLETLQPMRTSI